MQDKTIKARHLSFKYHSNFLFETLNFEIKTGELFIITGENGSGKSTLLRLLAGLTNPYVGEVLNPFSDNFHYLGHHNGLKLGLTVKENIKLLCHLHHLKDREKEIERFIHELNLHHHLEKITERLSQGEKRRLSLLKLWLIPKALWILDEPCNALDQKSQTLFFSHLTKHLENNHIAIISSHQDIPILKMPVKYLRIDSC